MIDDRHDDEATAESEKPCQYPRCDTNESKSRINDGHEASSMHSLDGLARRRPPLSSVGRTCGFMAPLSGPFAAGIQGAGQEPARWSWFS